MRFGVVFSEATSKRDLSWRVQAANLAVPIESLAAFAVAILEAWLHVLGVQDSFPEVWPCWVLEGLRNAMSDPMLPC